MAQPLRGSSIAFRPAVRPALVAGLSGRSRRPPRSAGAAVVFKEQRRDIMELKHIDIANLSVRSEEHTSELQSLMRISYAVFCLKKKTKKNKTHLQHGKNKNNRIH